MSNPCSCGRTTADHWSINQAATALTLAIDFILTHRGQDVTVDDVVPFLPPRNPTGCPQNDLRERVTRLMAKAGITVCGARLS